MDRLTLQHADVRAALNTLPRDVVPGVVRRIAVAAAESCGVLPECEAAEDPQALVAALDEVAWALQEADDLEAYEAAFRRARAADAWKRSLTVVDGEEAADVLYEAVHALGGETDPRPGFLRGCGPSYQ